MGPSYICYGFDNRAAAIRIPSLSAQQREEGTRIEFRLPDATSLDETELKKMQMERVPQTLTDALTELKRSSYLKETLGENLVRTYVRNREAEWQVYMERVSEWEIRTYSNRF